MKKTFLIVCAISALTLGMTACGGGPGAVDLGPGLQDAEQQKKENYNTTMERMRTTLEDPNAPPIDQSINTANRAQLLQMARRWDDATQVAASAVPPKEIAAAHKDMVAAMRDLGEWNHKIAEAAPNKAMTRKLGKQAQNSASSKEFGKARDSIEAQGFSVLTVNDDPNDPFADAPAP